MCIRDSEKGVTLTAAFDGDVPRIWIDHDRIMQVMLNLLSNAVKFSPAGSGVVQVTVTRNDDELQVNVTDNGPGISLEDQAIIFDKFRQGGDRRRARPPGTGLGLPISVQIISHFGGSLWVESAPDAGAPFSFTLPLATESRR